MPIYNFKCECGAEYEELVPLNTNTFKCSCGKDATKVPSLTNFQLKGNGWAKDNYGLVKDKK